MSRKFFDDEGLSLSGKAIKSDSSARLDSGRNSSRLNAAATIASASEHNTDLLSANDRHRPSDIDPLDFDWLSQPGSVNSRSSSRTLTSAKNQAANPTSSKRTAQAKSNKLQHETDAPKPNNDDPALSKRDNAGFGSSKWSVAAGTGSAQPSSRSASSRRTPSSTTGPNRLRTGNLDDFLNDSSKSTAVSDRKSSRKPPTQTLTDKGKIVSSRSQRTPDSTARKKPANKIEAEAPIQTRIQLTNEESACLERIRRSCAARRIQRFVKRHLRRKRALLAAERRIRTLEAVPAASASEVNSKNAPTVDDGGAQAPNSTLSLIREYLQSLESLDVNSSNNLSSRTPRGTNSDVKPANNDTDDVAKLRKSAWMENQAVPDEEPSSLNNSARKSARSARRKKETSTSVSAASTARLSVDNREPTVVRTFRDEPTARSTVSASVAGSNNFEVSTGRPSTLVKASNDWFGLNSRGEQETETEAEGETEDAESTLRSEKMPSKLTKQNMARLDDSITSTSTIGHSVETESRAKRDLENLLRQSVNFPQSEQSITEKESYEETIQRHLTFIDELIADKRKLTEKCAALLATVRRLEETTRDSDSLLDQKVAEKVRNARNEWEAAEELRRERWIEEKTKRIREQVMKQCEAEVHAMTNKHREELRQLRMKYEADMLSTDARASERYVKMIEELRAQLDIEKEQGIERERQLAKQRFEKQLRDELEAIEKQRKRVQDELRDERDRLAEAAEKQRAEIAHERALLTAASEQLRADSRRTFDDEVRRINEKHEAEMCALADRMDAEKKNFSSEIQRRFEAEFNEREKQLREAMKAERDREIELALGRLEQDIESSRRESERSTEARIRRIREKYESEISEVEKNEKQAVQRYNEMKAHLVELETDNERYKSLARQKETEVENIRALYEKLNRERTQMTDVIRQEFAEKLIALDDENKRMKQELSELRAKQKIEQQNFERRLDSAQKDKEIELEEIHRRVKLAIAKKEEVVTKLREQYEQAQSRADHLEALLEQQRQLLIRTTK